MSRWETTSTLAAEAPPASVWERAYADADAWPGWKREAAELALSQPAP